MLEMDEMESFSSIQPGHISPCGLARLIALACTARTARVPAPVAPADRGPASSGCQKGRVVSQKKWRSSKPCLNFGKFRYKKQCHLVSNLVLI